MRRNLLMSAAAVVIVAAAVGFVLSAALPAVATEPTAKWCEGVKIAAFTGGWEPEMLDRLSTTIYNGYAQAAADLGPTATYYFSHWDADRIASDLKTAVGAKVDGVAFIGLPGDAKVDALIDQAVAQGTIVTTMDVALPEAQKKYANQGMGYVGASNYAVGVALANEAAKRAGLKAGDSVFVWGDKYVGGDLAQRATGVVDAFEKLGAKVIYQDVDPALVHGGGKPMKDFADFMAANPDVKIVVPEGGMLTSGVYNLALMAGLRPGQVFFAGFDLSPSAVGAIKEGYLNFVFDQQPYLQGYLSILNICLTKKFGFSGLNVDTTGAFVDSSNVDAVAPLVAKQIR
jgi:simple sugar transport system substrate-binding protein